MLITRGLDEFATETAEWMIAEAFADGKATRHHYDCLCDMRNVVILSSAYKKDKSAGVICEAMWIVLLNVRERHERTGKIGTTGDELQTVRAFIGYYRDFWLRQPAVAYDLACNELGRFNEMSAAKSLPSSPP